MTYWFILLDVSIQSRSQMDASMSYNNNNSNDNKVWETAADDLENDESASDPLEVMLPSTQEGEITHFCI